MALMSPSSLCQIASWQRLVASIELEETGNERAGSSHLKNDLEIVILLSQQKRLTSLYTYLWRQTKYLKLQSSGNTFIITIY